MAAAGRGHRGSRVVRRAHRRPLPCVQQQRPNWPCCLRSRSARQPTHARPVRRQSHPPDPSEAVDASDQYTPGLGSTAEWTWTPSSSTMHPLVLRVVRSPHPPYRDPPGTTAAPFFPYAHIDGVIAADPAVYARLAKVQRGESRTQGLGRRELIRFPQVRAGDHPPSWRPGVPAWYQPPSCFRGGSVRIKDHAG